MQRIGRSKGSSISCDGRDEEISSCVLQIMGADGADALHNAFSRAKRATLFSETAQWRTTERFSRAQSAARCRNFRAPTERTACDQSFFSGSTFFGSSMFLFSSLPSNALIKAFLKATGWALRMESSKEKRMSRTAKLMAQRANPNEPATTMPKESPMDSDLASALALAWAE